MRKPVRAYANKHTFSFAIALVALGVLAMAGPRTLSWVRPSPDKSRFAAESALAEGDRLRNEWTAEACKRAIEKFKEALSYWGATNDLGGESAVLRRIGKVYESLGDWQKALDYYNWELLLYQRAGDSGAESEALSNVGYTYLFLNKNREALELCTKALNLSRLVGHPQGEANALNRLGEVYYFIGEMKEALNYYNQALPLCLALGDRQGQAQALLHLGDAYLFLSETQKALLFCERALPLWRAINDRQGEALTLNAMGDVKSRLGEKQEALNLYTRAAQMIKLMGDKVQEAIVLDGIAYVYNELGDKEKSLKYYYQALHLYQSAGVRIAEAGQLRNICEVHYSLGNIQEALDSCQRSLTLTRALTNPRLESSLFRTIGMIHESLGHVMTALGYYTRARSLKRTSNDLRGEAYALNNIGQLYDKRGERQKAIEYYLKALSLNRAASDRFGESLTLYNIARAERDRGNLGASRSRMEDSIRIIESLRTKVNSQDLRTSYFSSIHQQYECYTGLLMHLHKKQTSGDFDITAFEASERTRARGLLDLLTESQASIRQGINPELLKLERSLQQSLNDKADRQARMLSDKHNEEELAAVTKEIQELTTQYDRVKAQIRAESPRYAALTQPQPSSLQEIQRLLDDDTLLLEYSLGEEHSYLWAVTRTGLKSFELPSRARIQEAARPVYELLSLSGGAQRLSEKEREVMYRRKAEELSRMLIRPAAEQLGNKRLLVVPDGILQYIPFGALPNPRATKPGAKATDRVDAVPMIVEHEIVNLPSASTLAVLRRETEGRRPAPKTVAVLADPVFETDDLRVLAAGGKLKGAPADQVASNASTASTNRRGLRRDGGFARLPATQNEAQAIEEMTTASERLIANGFDASLAEATSPELGQYRIIHFATHGILDSDNPELSAIVLSLVDPQGKSQQGYLRLHDIYNLNLPAELVVLSACNTGLGKEIKGEGLIGLTRGFMYAGAARVMASLWKVEDEPTALLMKHFYQGMLKEGQPPAAALRKAQVALWQDGRWRAPEYWAAFVLQGEWR